MLLRATRAGRRGRADRCGPRRRDAGAGQRGASRHVRARPRLAARGAGAARGSAARWVRTAAARTRCWPRRRRWWPRRRGVWPSRAEWPRACGSATGVVHQAAPTRSARTLGRDGNSRLHPQRPARDRAMPHRSTSPASGCCSTRSACCHLAGPGCWRSPTCTSRKARPAPSTAAWCRPGTPRPRCDRLAAAAARAGGRRIVVALGDSFHDRDGFGRLRMDAAGAARLQAWAGRRGSSGCSATTIPNRRPGLPASWRNAGSSAALAFCHQARRGVDGRRGRSAIIHPKASMPTRAGRRDPALLRRRSTTG